jgi:hypothetical protein
LGGLDIGLDKKMLDQATSMPGRKALIDRITDTISSLSLKKFKRSFSQLDIEQRENLLNTLLNNKQNTIGRRDLMRVRNTLMIWYYQSPEGRDSIGYKLPAHYAAYNN